MEMHSFYLAIDPFLIWFYRITGYAAVDVVIGTLVLAFLTLTIGEFTAAVAMRFTRARTEKHSESATKYQDLAIDALRAGNKEAYKAANMLANDSFGHAFFQQVALSASFLWPIFFALAWMQYRFLDIEFPIPGTSWSMGFIGLFIIMYIIAFFLFKRIKRMLALSTGRKRSNSKINLGAGIFGGIRRRLGC
jgi:hypothetical protein